MTDISTIVAIERTIDILHPKTGAQIGLRITLRPDSHPKVREASRRAMNDRIAGRGKITAEKLEANRLDLIGSAVESWQWIGDATFEGEKPEATPDNVRKVLKKLPWLRDQIDKELGETEEFFRDADDGTQ